MAPWYRRLVNAEGRWFMQRFDHPIWSRWPAVLTFGWWEYVLNDSRADKEYGAWDLHPWTWCDHYVPNPFAFVANYLERVRCRWRGHRCGTIWYSGGYEPDTRCRTCGEDIG